MTVATTKLSDIISSVFICSVAVLSSTNKSQSHHMIHHWKRWRFLIGHASVASLGITIAARDSLYNIDLYCNYCPAARITNEWRQAYKGNDVVINHFTMHPMVCVVFPFSSLRAVISSTSLHRTRSTSRLRGFLLFMKTKSYFPIIVAAGRYAAGRSLCFIGASSNSFFLSFPFRLLISEVSGPIVTRLDR